MLVSVGVSTLNALLRNLMFKFMQRLDDSTNSIMVMLSNPIESCSRFSSRLRVHWLKFLYVFSSLSVFLFGLIIFVCFVCFFYLSCPVCFWTLKSGK